jgi:hypothetical protein
VFFFFFWWYGFLYFNPLFCEVLKTTQAMSTECSAQRWLSRQSRGPRCQLPKNRHFYRQSLRVIESPKERHQRMLGSAMRQVGD